ncbi:recombinase family protein (plasmid) [Guyparkeria sp. 1SP6A2]|nr:recombinase family protein [Guyparkeria sp. 1SP6A2]
MKVARIYLRVSTETQDLERQERVIEDAQAQGFYVAAVYREKASGTKVDRPELKRLINDLQKGEVVVAEKMDRISRLPLPEAEKLVQAIENKGAKIAVPGVLDLSELVEKTEGVSRVVLESVQAMLMRVALQLSRDEYETRRKRQKEGVERAKTQGKYRGRKPDRARHARIVELRRSGVSIRKTAELVGVSDSTVKRAWSAVSPKKT